MLAQIRARLTYANVVATLALFVALGGVSYAAVKLPARSVGMKQLKTGAVSSEKVKDGTLRKRDFKDGQMPRGRTGDPGQDGQPGDPGAAGHSGAPGTPGTKGDAGAAGAAGATGTDGPAGSKGADGANGGAGPPGPAGPAGPAGPTGVAGPAGALGAQGPTGLTGPPGSTGVVTTARISGFIASIVAADGVYQFAGAQAVVTTTAVQRITGAAMVPVAVTGSPQTIRLDLCYQPNAGGALTAFSGGSYSLVAVTATRIAQPVAGTVLPGAGTWRVGACTMTTANLDNNDFVNGYIQVTN